MSCVPRRRIGAFLMSDAVDLYDNVYGDFASDAEAAVRRAAYGDDIGQSSWMTAAAWLRFADQPFLACVHRLSTGRRLSRFSYLAEKAA